MRLQSKEVDVIAEAAKDTFMSGTAVFLFGSRVDDRKRGGDIDLLVEIPEALSPAELVRSRTRFVSRIYRLLDEQRIRVGHTVSKLACPFGNKYQVRKRNSFGR